MEIKAREFDALLYLAARCVQAGFPVLIGPRSRIWRFFRKDAGDMPIFYVAKELWHIEDVITPNMKLFTLDEEGGGEYTLDGVIRTHCLDIQDRIEKIFTWGQVHKDFLVRQGGRDEQIIVTGHPRFDIKKPQFAPYYHGLAQKLNKPERYILIASNFAAGNPILGYEWLLKHTKIMYGEDSEYIGLLREAHDEELVGIEAMSKLARALAARFPDMQIVWRPHPVEELSFYQERFSEPNIVFTKEGDAHEWIADASAYIHVDCTTSIEAFVFGKDVISFSPSRRAKAPVGCPEMISHVAQGVDDAVDFVAAAIARQGRSTLTEEEYQRRLSTVEQVIANMRFDAASAIADVLVDTARDQGIEGSPPPRPKSLIYRLAKKLRRFLKGTRLNEFDRLVKNKMPGISMAEVRMRLDLLREVYPELPEISAREFDIDCFLLQ